VSQEKDRKQLNYAERAAVAAEIRSLLDARDAEGKKIWSQQALGAAMGGLSQETVRRGRHADSVGPATRDGLLKHLGITIEQLIQKHDVPHQDPDHEKAERARARETELVIPFGDPNDSKPPELVRLGRLAMALLMQEPYEYDPSDAWRMVEGLLYARKHSTEITPQRLAQLAHLTETELRGKPLGQTEDVRTMPDPPAATRSRKAK
jgi:hypothetical protein